MKDNVRKMRDADLVAMERALQAVPAAFEEALETADREARLADRRGVPKLARSLETLADAFRVISHASSIGSREIARIRGLLDEEEGDRRGV